MLFLLGQEGRKGPKAREKHMGHTPSTAGTFRKKFRKNSGKTPETLSERFLEFPSRVRLGCPKPYNSRHLRLPERFQNSLPPQYGWGRFFFQNWSRRGPLRAGVMEFPAVLGAFLSIRRIPVNRERQTRAKKGRTSPDREAPPI